MYTHICVGAKDLDESQKFYDAAPDAFRHK